MIYLLIIPAIDLITLIVLYRANKSKQKQNKEMLFNGTDEYFVSSFEPSINLKNP